MQHILAFGCRANVLRCLRSYRPQLESFEDRLPLGDALLGAWLGSSLLGPGLALVDADMAPATSGGKTVPVHHGLVQTGTALVRNQQPLSDPCVPLAAPGSFQEEASEARGQTATATVGWPDDASWGASDARLPKATLAQLAALVSTRAPLAEMGPVHPAPMAEASTTTPSPAVVSWPGSSQHFPAQPAWRTLSQRVTTGAASGSTDALQPNASLGKQQVVTSYSQLPLSFEANVGQADAQVQFLAHGPGYSLYLTGSEALMVLNRPFAPKAMEDLTSGGVDHRRSGRTAEINSAARSEEAQVVRMQVLGGKAGVQAVGEQQLPGTVNYFLGNDSTKWHTHIATYGRVTYANVYPGIDLVYYGSQQQLEYDFVVSPGADPTQIQVGFTGADHVAVDAQGDLVLRAGGQEIHQHKPVVYQNINGVRQTIPSAFTIVADPAPLTTYRIGFALGAYDPGRPVVIDPVLSYSTYLGGSGSAFAQAIAVDGDSNAYITGVTLSAGFPTVNALQPAYGGGFADTFVAKLTADGSSLLYSTYFGGSGTDIGNSIAVDGAGNAYVTGSTNSTDFPTVNALQPASGGGFDAFVAKLTADGSALLYSTYLGGGAQDKANSIAVDGAGNAYVTGSTNSTDFPTVNGLQPASGGGMDAFVAKLAADGSALLYSTYLGGSGADFGQAITVDGDGNAYVTGSTSSTDFPTVNALQPTYGGGFENTFVAKLTADGSALLHSTYLGGSGTDTGNGIAVDGAGNAYITGSTSSTDFPTANALQPASGGSMDAFVAKLAADGSALLYSTYLGGRAQDNGYGIAVDGAGNAYVTGSTRSTDFPTANALQPASGGASDAFVTKLSADGSALLYSSYLGGSSFDDGYGIAVDRVGNAYVTGSTSSTDFPTANALQPAMSGLQDAFVARISF